MKFGGVKILLPKWMGDVVELSHYCPSPTCNRHVLSPVNCRAFMFALLNTEVDNIMMTILEQTLTSVSAIDIPVNNFGIWCLLIITDC